MSVPLNKDLYQKARAKADEVYGEKTSAFKSGYIQQQYKKMGGKYKKQSASSRKKNPLAEWFNAQWKNINPDKKGYPLFRPTRRVSKRTPLTVDEIDPKNLKQQMELKQKIKGTQNLPPFKKKKKDAK